MNRLKRLPAVEEAVGLKRSAIYKLAREGRFPTPVKLGRSTAWVEDEVQAWIDAQIRARRDPGAEP